MFHRPRVREALALSIVCIGFILIAPSWFNLVFQYSFQVAGQWMLRSLNNLLGSPGAWNLGSLTWGSLQFMTYMTATTILVVVPGILGLQIMRILILFFDWLAERHLPAKL